MVQRANPQLLKVASDGKETLRSYQLQSQPLQQADFNAALAQVQPATTAQQVARYHTWRHQVD